MIRAARQPRSAWTLRELLLVLVIFGIVLGLLITSLHTLREHANRLTCQAHLKDLILAVHRYHGDKGVMPPYASGRGKEIYGSWFLHLLPHVDHVEVYNRLLSGQRTQSQGLRLMTMGQYLPGVHDAAFPELVCPSDPTRASGADNLTNYLANWYALSDDTRGTLRPAQRLSNLTDGLSNVVILAEGYSTCDGLPRLALYSAHYHNFGITQDGLASDAPYYAPQDYTMFQVHPEQCDHWRTQTPHRAMNVALADGSVRSVEASISATTWIQVLKPRDGVQTGSDW